MRVAVLCVLVLSVSIGPVVTAQEMGQTLLEERKGHRTKLTRKESDPEPLETSPEKLFSIVRYKSPAGELSAYLGKPPAAEGKHPAIIWITGGFPPGGIDADAWQPVSSENDQSAKS